MLFQYEREHIKNCFLQNTVRTSQCYVIRMPFKMCSTTVKLNSTIYSLLKILDPDLICVIRKRAYGDENVVQHHALARQQAGWVVELATYHRVLLNIPVRLQK